MKQFLLFFSICLFIFGNIAYSLPDFWYTGTAFDGTGALHPDESSTLDIRLTISQGGSPVYTETWNSQSTNAFAIFSVKTGTGASWSGTALGTLTIDANTTIQAEVRKSPDSYVVVGGGFLNHTAENNGLIGNIFETDNTWNGTQTIANSMWVTEGTTDLSNGSSGNTNSLRVNANGNSSNAIYAQTSNDIANNYAVVLASKVNGGDGATGWFEDLGSGNGSILFATNDFGSPSTNRYVAEFRSNDGTDSPTLRIENNNGTSATTALQVGAGNVQFASIDNIDADGTDISTLGNYTVIRITSASAITYNMPAGADGQTLYLINASGIGFEVTDGTSNFVISSSTAPYFGYHFVSMGGAWYQI